MSSEIKNNNNNKIRRIGVKWRAREVREKVDLYEAVKARGTQKEETRL